MRRYTSELINEMNEAVRISRKLKKRLSCDNAEKNASFMGKNAFHFRAKNYGNPIKLEDIIGIPSEVLPPDNLLKKEEKAELSRIMIELMNIWNFFPEFPDNLPDHVKYKHLKKVWSSEQVYMGMGENKIEFCNYDDSQCPFIGFCSFCDDIKEQEKLYNQLIRERTNQSNSNNNRSSHQ
jgi:hypothetical protein